MRLEPAVPVLPLLGLVRLGAAAVPALAAGVWLPRPCSSIPHASCLHARPRGDCPRDHRRVSGGPGLLSGPFGTMARHACKMDHFGLIFEPGLVHSARLIDERAERTILSGLTQVRPAPAYTGAHNHRQTGQCSIARLLHGVLDSGLDWLRGNGRATNGGRKSTGCACGGRAVPPGWVWVIEKRLSSHNCLATIARLRREGKEVDERRSLFPHTPGGTACRIVWIPKYRHKVLYQQSAPEVGAPMRSKAHLDGLGY